MAKWDRPEVTQMSKINSNYLPIVPIHSTIMFAGHLQAFVSTMVEILDKTCWLCTDQNVLGVRIMNVHCVGCSNRVTVRIRCVNHFLVYGLWSFTVRVKLVTGKLTNIIHDNNTRNPVSTIHRFINDFLTIGAPFETKCGCIVPARKNFLYKNC